MVLAAIAGCAETAASPSGARAGGAKGYGGGDGLSCATRVIIHADNEIAGVNAEYAWLDSRYPGYERGMQSLGKCAASPADILHVKTADGREFDVYFDISEYFGRF